ncbi:hypothetical protein G9A89_008150 [Geosiphon pyriformis]|nr:hypothetical protein G9A89_008150 [Geosiphon pyriformis]
MSLSFLSKIPKVVNSYFVNNVSYAKASVPPTVFGFFSLVASVPLALLLAASFAVPVVDSVVKLRLDSMEKQISDLSALVKSVIKPISSLVILVTALLNDNAAKAPKVEKDLLIMCNASNGFANLLVSLSKHFASLKTEMEFGNLDNSNISVVKTSLLSKDTVDHVVALWQMCSLEVKGSSEKTRLFSIGVLTDLSGWPYVEKA